MIKLRPYQEECVAAIMGHVEGSQRLGLLVLATGLGKTAVATETIQRVAERGRKTLFLANRRTLVFQAADKFREYGLSVGIEMAEQLVLPMEMRSRDVVVATVQSLVSEHRLSRYPKDYFGLIIVDEAHHHRPEGAFADLAEYWDGAKLLGLTATPTKETVSLYDHVLYEMGIREGIDGGWLVPIKSKQVQVDELDMSRVKVRGGDLVDSDLARLFEKESLVHGACQATVGLAGDRPTVVFTPSVASAHAAMGHLNAMRGAHVAEAIDASTPQEERDWIFERYRKGDLQYLCNCAVLTEGWDAPWTSCVALMRPTMSRGLYQQMAGRGTRTWPGKTDLLLLDFVGNSGRHTLISSLDLLDDSLDDATREVAKKIVDAGEEDIATAIDEARAQIALEAQMAAVREALARQERTYRERDVDPWDVFGVSKWAGRQRGMAATEAQIGFLRRVGIPVDTMELNKGNASSLIAKVISRRESGQCTPSQAMRLVSAGLDPNVSAGEAQRLLDQHGLNGPTDKQRQILLRYGYQVPASRKEASKIIDKIASNGWKR